MCQARQGETVRCQPSSGRHTCHTCSLRHCKVPSPILAHDYTAIMQLVQRGVMPVPAVLSVWLPGKKAFIARAHNDGVLLEFWSHGRMVKVSVVTPNPNLKPDPNP